RCVADDHRELAEVSGGAEPAGYLRRPLLADRSLAGGVLGAGSLLGEVPGEDRPGVVEGRVSRVGTEVDEQLAQFGGGEAGTAGQAQVVGQRPARTARYVDRD